MKGSDQTLKKSSTAVGILVSPAPVYTCCSGLAGNRQTKLRVFVDLQGKWPYTPIYQADKPLDRCEFAMNCKE
jgi:hypothetical protein